MLFCQAVVALVVCAIVVLFIFALVDNEREERSQRDKDNANSIEDID